MLNTSISPFFPLHGRLTESVAILDRSCRSQKPVHTGSLVASRRDRVS